MTGEILIKKNGRDYIRIALESYQGHRLTTLRVWFPPPDGGPLRPGRDGFGLNILVLPELIAGLQRLASEAQAVGWLPSLDLERETVCQDCGARFLPARADARFCSPKCRAKASRTRRADSANDPHGSARGPVLPGSAESER